MSKYKQNKIHYDYIAARKYAKENGKELQDLTKEELNKFKVEAKAICIDEEYNRT